MNLRKSLAIWAFGCAFGSTAAAEDVHAAVAANFAAAMKEIVVQFENKNAEHKVILSFGSSGKIFAQIRHGAPFQLFLSADQEKPAELEQAGLTVAGSRFTYAVGGLVLWSATPGFVDSSYANLKSGNFNKLSLANPKLAPYGAAAVEVLEALGLKTATESKWVMGENIAQAYQFAATGNADLGFVALSQVMDGGRVTTGSGWVIPSDLHTPIRQDAVLLKRGENSAGAKALLEFLRSDEARAIMRSSGYVAE